MRTRLITKVLFIFSLLGSGMLLLVGLLVAASAASADTEQGEGLLALGVLASVLGSLLVLAGGYMVAHGEDKQDLKRGARFLAIGTILAWVGLALIVYWHERDRDMMLVVYVTGVLPGTLACMWSQLLVRRAPPVGGGAIQCSSCGLTVEDGAKLCNSCGSRLSG